MNQKVAWLIGLLIVWMTVAVIWMGFTLPAMTGYAPGVEILIQSPLAAESMSGTGDEEYTAPLSAPSLNSPMNSHELLATQDRIENWKEWVKRQSEGHPVRLVVTGYQLNEEKAHTAIGRAKVFKNTFDNSDSLDFVLVEEYKDNIVEENGILLDVIGVSIVKDFPGDDIKFRIESTAKNLDEEIEKIQRISALIQASGGHFLELTYCKKNAYEDLEENRDRIRRLKNELMEIGVPRHKIIGNLQDSPSDTPKIIIELK